MPRKGRHIWAGLLRINEAKKEGWEGLEDWLSDVLQMHMSVRLSSDLPRYAQIFSVIWTPQMMLGPVDTLLDSSVSVEKCMQLERPSFLKRNDALFGAAFVGPTVHSFTWVTSTVRESFGFTHIWMVFVGVCHSF